MLEVLGAFDVPIDESARAITPQEGPEFFEEHPHLAARRGVYVFAMRAGKGIMPWYVGKAARGFRGECFTLDKALKYTIAMNKQGKGTPVLFFVALPLRKKGPTNTTVIAGVETFLIRAAKARNPDLLNKQGVKAENWGITGVLRGTRGKP